MKGMMSVVLGGPRTGEGAGDGPACCPPSATGAARHSTIRRRRIDDGMPGGYHPRRPPFERDAQVAGTAEQAVVLETALAAAVRDADEDPTLARRRLAALRLSRAYAGAADLD